jgi:hypothetical protein
MKKALAHAALAALALGVLSTFGDFLWEALRLRHRVVTGIGHGAVICLAIGLAIGLRAGRPLPGVAIGPLVGMLAAATFYLLAPMLGWNAMFPAWMLFWICFALLQAWLVTPSRGMKPRPTEGMTARRYAPHLARGLVAAVLSGAAFYLVSGMWTNPPRGGPNYAMNLLNWTFAFFPGFLALFWPGRAAVER